MPIRCVVEGCDNKQRLQRTVMFHRFPPHHKRRKVWLAALAIDPETPTGLLKNWRVCSEHFTEDDYTSMGSRLNETATPTIIKSRTQRRRSSPIAEELRDECKDLPGQEELFFEVLSLSTTQTHRAEESTPEVQVPSSVQLASPSCSTKPAAVLAPTWTKQSDTASSSTMMAKESGQVSDHDYCITPATAGQLIGENEMLKKKVLELERLQLHSRFGLHRVAGSDEDIRFYTRFASYTHFVSFWQLIEPAVINKMRVTGAASVNSSQQKATKLAPIDELLLFLMHLSAGLPLRDLSKRFDIPSTTASRIISTWTSLLYFLLGSIRLWMSQDEVKARLPPEFESYPDIQVILDCMEIRCQTPSSLLLQSDVLSTYKSHTKFKALIGIAPHGPITFVSGLYAGSISDPELFKISGITDLLTADTAIMIDKGFVVDFPTPCKVYQSTFLSRNGHMCGEGVRQMQSITRLSGHVERCIRRVKENKLLSQVIPLSVCGSIDQLFSVACILVNFQNGPLPGQERDAPQD